ncbi:hypothetical protein ATCC90586_005764 [Pythium insidiosum]|nr:hypothetical protein ATCC90586_005764 [Pythium insidiosum]
MDAAGQRSATSQLGHVGAESVALFFVSAPMAVAAVEKSGAPSTPSAAVKKDWHASTNLHVRRRVLLQILMLLKAKYGKVDPKISYIARRAELALYTQAHSASEYRNPKTLSRRLHSLVIKLHMNNLLAHEDEAFATEMSSCRPCGTKRNALCMTAEPAEAPRKRARLSSDAFDQSPIFFGGNTDLLRVVTSFLETRDALRLATSCRSANEVVPSFVTDVNVKVLALDALAPTTRARFFHRFPNLERIELRGDAQVHLRIDFRGEDALVRRNVLCRSFLMALGSQPLPRLRCLRLSHVYLDSASDRISNQAAAVAVNTSFFPELREFALVGNAVSDSGVSFLCGLLAAQAATSRLEVVDLESNFVGERGRVVIEQTMAAVNAMRSDRQTLLEFRLRENLRRWHSLQASAGPNGGKHVVVGMSGGVDSSVTALLLVQAGYRVTGVFMKNWDASDEIGEQACPQDIEFQDVQKVCRHLGIEARRVNLVQSYWNSVFAPCLESYEEGLTPNPDILCNREIKFKAFLDYAASIGADYVATGHYASLRPDPRSSSPHPVLFAAEDETKDQSYFLSNVAGSAFRRVLFPLGELPKTEVRRIAAEEGLVTASKRDSVGICFIGKRNFADFIHQYIPKQDGFFVTVDGQRLQAHNGFTAYTVGQGARLQGKSEKWFVVGKRKRDHAVIVAAGTKHPALFTDTLFASATQFNWIAGSMPEELVANGRMRCFYRVRYRQVLGECTISLVTEEDARADATQLHDWSLEAEEISATPSRFLRVDFDQPQRGVTPQQALVLYRDDGLCFGGGPIAGAGRSYHELNKPLDADVFDWRSQ